MDRKIFFYHSLTANIFMNQIFGNTKNTEAIHDSFTLRWPLLPNYY